MSTTFASKINQLQYERNYGEAFDCCKPDWLNFIMILSGEGQRSGGSCLAAAPRWGCGWRKNYR